MAPDSLEIRFGDFSLDLSGIYSSVRMINISLAILVHRV